MGGEILNNDIAILSADEVSGISQKYCSCIFLCTGAYDAI